MPKSPSDYGRPLRVVVDKTLGYEYFMDKEHPLASQTGRVWYHRHVASVRIGRWLTADEIVHHRDGDRANNRLRNLEVTTLSEHAREHTIERNMRRGIPPLGEMKCPVCRVKFPRTHREQKFCSTKCSNLARRKAQRPSKSQLKRDVESLSWVAIGRKYGVSDNAVRKWARQYGLVA